MKIQNIDSWIKESNTLFQGTHEEVEKYLNDAEIERLEHLRRCLIFLCKAELISEKQFEKSIEKLNEEARKLRIYMYNSCNLKKKKSLFQWILEKFR